MLITSSHRPGFICSCGIALVGLAAVAASVVIVAMNPTKQLNDARDAQRRSDVNTILNATYQYAIDNNGELPPGIPLGKAKEICATDATDCTDLVNLDVLTGLYLVSVPNDPLIEFDSNTTGYLISQDENARVTVETLLHESGSPISITR